MSQQSAPPLDGASIARRTWEMTNAVAQQTDELYAYNDTEQAEIRAAKPWERDPQYFKQVRISALALLKMVMHARSGGNIEIMGLMQGKVGSLHCKRSAQ